MVKLDKIHKDYLMGMVEQKETVRSFNAYCRGAGFDTSSYSSPVHIDGNNKLCIRYRGVNSYYYLRS